MDEKETLMSSVRERDNTAMDSWNVMSSTAGSRREDENGQTTSLIDMRFSLAPSKVFSA